MEILIVFIGLFLFLVVKGFFDRKNAKARLITNLKASWGMVPQNEYSEEKYRSLQFYYHTKVVNKQEKQVQIDEITWHDLNLDYLFSMVNATNSSMGEEYLWALLHVLKLHPEELSERERVITFFQEHPEERLRLQVAFAMIGRNKKYSVYEYMSQMENVKQERNLIHYLILALMLAGLAILPLSGGIGGGILVFCVVFNIITYYKRKGETAPYFTALSYILRMLEYAKKVGKEDIAELQEYTISLKEKTERLQTLLKGVPVVAPQNVTGDMLSMLLDYVRIIFHTDLIRFNQMMKKYIQEREAIFSVFETIGFMDAMCAVASFRDMLPYSAKPSFCLGKHVSAEGLYHPFLTEPVPADIQTEKSVLVTGSNASGKSTFLKSVAINAILAQTIHTVCAKSYHADYFRVMTSMALTDDILGGESYYIVEIRSLMRILSAAEKNGAPVLCFVDEVLRGTNTVERIAASSRILCSIAEKNALIFAATHDIELTYMLENIFENYHFEEHIKENEIFFDYELKKGRSTTKNAIRLLSLMGYPERIVAEAEETAAYFTESGEWRKIK